LNRKQIIAITAALVLTVALYFGTSNVKPQQKEDHTGHNHAPGEEHEHDHEHTPANGPMMGGAMVMAADFDSLVADVKKRLLSPQINAEIENIEQKAKTATDKDEKFKAYESLGKRWQAIGQKGIAAHYFANAGDLVNSEKILNFAAHLYEEGMSKADNAAVRKLYADGKVNSLNKVVGINPNNDTATMDLALAMIDQGDVMNGVFKLRDFAEKNPKNIRAQVTLGKMALQSNQLDKAIERGKIVLALDKDNFEAHLFMGEAYKNAGEIDKAIEIFNQAKKILKNPDFDKEMDEYIATFKK
jgi:tetratricopeptide (TPR) repeat protein